MEDNRISLIYKIIHEQNQVFVEELAKELNISESTIRRDLQKMESMKLINRFYGGARLNPDVKFEPTMHAKHLVNMQGKASIAKYAASLIKDNDVIYIDAGTTTEMVVDYIYAKNVLVITQALSIMQKLNDRQIRCYTYGGSLRFSTNIIVDTSTIERINENDFDICFIGSNAIHHKLGLSTTNDIEAMLKHSALKRSSRRYVLADHSKFNQISSIKFADINEVTIITDEYDQDIINTFKTDIICTNKK